MPSFWIFIVPKEKFKLTAVLGILFYFLATLPRVSGLVLTIWIGYAFKRWKHTHAKKRVDRDDPTSPSHKKKMPPVVMQMSASLMEADKLDMDHVRIPLFDFLWGYTFVGLCTFASHMKGIATLLIRQHLVRVGLQKPQPCNPSNVVGMFFLEGMICVCTGTSTPSLMMESQQVSSFRNFLSLTTMESSEQLHH
jgi:hypothetical protein